MEDAKRRVSEYTKNVARPFKVSYNAEAGEMIVDRAIRTRPEIEDPTLPAF